MEVRFAKEGKAQLGTVVPRALLGCRIEEKLVERTVDPGNVWKRSAERWIWEFS